MSTGTAEPLQDIAVIGLAGRFPGAETLAQFWENLAHGVESVRKFSAEELASAGVSKALLKDPDYVRAGAPLSHLDAFDAAFFGIGPREAALMDPQQRFFLEEAWTALEHAGHAPGTFAGATAVFAACGANAYLIHNLLSDPELLERDGPFLLRHAGSDKDSLAESVAYHLDLRGPSINVQTACSSALVAVHLACESLRRGACDFALAGAVSVEIPHAIGYRHRPGEMASQDGHCRAFDASASGTVFGSGLGLVVLRRLADALADGDTIHAVIKGSAVNNDGSRKVGFLAPSLEAQKEVVAAALADGGIDPATVDYVEAHGAGAPIGDPIELTALAQVFGPRAAGLKVGSVKTNIGHADTAAGMAGLLKTVLALGHRQIPATLHFKKLNPLVDAATKLHVVDRLTEWKPDATPRRAGVSAFGLGGTNAHVVLEEPPAPALVRAARPVRLLTLSAKTAPALEDATRALAAHLRHAREDSLDDIAFTLHAGRAAFAHRRMFVARDTAEALQLAELPHSPGVVTGRGADPASVAFLFPGYGAQHVNLARELYRTEPVFQKWLDHCAAVARPHLGFDLRDRLYPGEANAARAAGDIRQLWNAQPILLAVEYALAQLWISWSVVPDQLIGHGVGEISAACLSGVFSLEDAIALVCARGVLMRRFAPGAMLAVARPEADVAGLLGDDLALAAVNSPEQCVVCGPAEAIAALQARLKEQGVVSHRPEAAHALHSAAIEPMLDAFTQGLASKTLRPPQIPIVSSITGTWLTDAEATDPRYWVRQMHQTVRFADGLSLLRAEPNRFFLEIGPGETLSALSRQYAGKEARPRIFPSLPCAGEKNGDFATMLGALGQLWINGAEIDWSAFHAQERRRRVPLPTYPFQRKKFWTGPKIGTNWLADSLGKVDDWFQRTTWKATPPLETAPAAGRWLVLAEATPEHAQLVDDLRRRGASVVCVVPGEAFRAGDGDEPYVANPSSEDDFAQLLDHLIKRRQVPQRVVHLWGLEPSADAEDRCFHSLLFLIKALGRLPGESVALTAWSRGSVALPGETVRHPYGSLLAGPCRVAPLEYPNLRCRQVDVDATASAALAAVILAEGDVPADGDGPGGLAVHRGGQRWTQEVEHFRPEPSPARLRPRGTYLITGGLGGLGMAVADWLARTQQARLVLLSRHADQPGAAHERRFAEWRKLGAEVLAVAADVTDRASLRRALDLAREQFGEPHGIFHAAGVLHDGIIQLKKKETAHAVLAPKVQGLQALDELTRGLPLDFFVLFSSVSALTPPDGQVDYCAANAFLNAYAQSRTAERRFLVIAWAPWSQTGMVAPKAERGPEPAPFAHPLLERAELDTAARTVYSGTLSAERHWVLAEHRLHEGDGLLPGAALLEIAVSALWRKIGRQPIVLENVVHLAPLRVAPGGSATIHAELHRNEGGFQFSVTSGDVVCVTGQCRPAAARPATIDLKEILARCPLERREPRHVRQLGHLAFGPRWASLRQAAFGQDECLGTAELPAAFRGEAADFALHPALLDAATGVALFLIPGHDKPGDLLLPFAAKRLTVHAPLPARVHCYARLRHESGSGPGNGLAVFDVTLAGDNGEVVAEIEEFTIQRLRGAADLATLQTAARLRLPEDDAPAKGIPTREGLEALQRLLKSHPPDVVYVSPSRLAPVIPMRERDAIADPLTASGDNVELVLTQLWQQLLGLERVDVSTDFFDSGGHSLLAVRLFTEIRKRFNVDFGLSTLFEARTIGALAELIRRTRVADPAQRAQSSSPGLVSIRSGSGDGAGATPFFLIHDVGGGVLRYEHLARHFPKEQPIYAIESRGLNGLPVDFTVEEMARHYVAQIRERQPHGPYYLAGHSFGGLVTYEIVRLLAAQGEPLGLVGLLDTYQRPITPEDAAGVPAAPRTDSLPFFKRLMTDLRAPFEVADRLGYLKERRTALQAWARKAGYRAAFDWTRRFGLGVPAVFGDVKEANWIASDVYVPRSYDGAVVLFRCSDRIDTDPPDCSHIWRRLVKNVTILEVPGDHNSMLREPQVTVLAEQILSYLPKTAAASGGATQSASIASS